MTDTKRVTGIGGIFFKARDIATLSAWYRDHLDIQVGDGHYAVFRWNGTESSESGQDAASGLTVWALFPHDTAYFEPGNAPFMINYRVADLDALLEQLRSEGVQIVDRRQESDEGRFAWIVDPEGNCIELWEPAPGQ